MTPIETLVPFLRDAGVVEVTLSAYRYVPRDMSDARRTFVVAMDRLLAEYDVIAATLDAEEEIAFHSHVVLRSGETLHVPMIDFLGPLEDAHLRELEKLLAEWSIPRLAIFASGRSFHGYGLALIAPQEWVRFMGRLLLSNAPEQAPWIDPRWIGHKLMAGSAALRWSRNSRIYDGEPKLVRMVYAAQGADVEKDDAEAKRTAQLLDQYKTYVADVGNIGARQAQTNTGYVSILSALLVILSLTNTAGALKDFAMAARAGVAVLAILICVLWRMHTQSFGLLYKAKFDVLREMETMLPFSCYTREWELLRNTRYSFFTKIEGRIARALMFPFVLLLIMAIVLMIIEWQ